MMMAEGNHDVGIDAMFVMMMLTRTMVIMVMVVLTGNGGNDSDVCRSYCNADE